MSKIKEKAKKLIQKSKESALLAVEIYNKPRATFRSYGYIVLMHIAWTALLHAIFEKRGVKYFYKKNKVRYKMIYGERLTWDLSKCVKEFYKNNNSAERKNLEFFIQIRDKIEHHFLPELDNDIFGECQAMLINYETLLTEEFGQKETINENLVFSLQFSKILHQSQQNAVKHRVTSEYKGVKDFISQYRGGLKKETIESLNYSFRVFLVPKIANHKTSSDFVLEFVKYDPTNPKEVEKYSHLIAVVKEKQVPMKGFKAGDVAKAVYSALKNKMPLDWKFNSSSHHVRCWKYYKIRPPKGALDPNKTNTKYCFYEPTFGQYGFTQEWINFLIKKLVNKKEFSKIMRTK